MTSRAAADRTLVFVTAHAGRNGGREAVEIFTLTGAGEDARLAWSACVPMPSAVQGNDIAVRPDGTIVVSNYRPDDSIVHTLKASLLGSTTGDVMVWRREGGWSHLAATQSAMANGVALSRDGNMLFFTESITGNVHRVPLDGSGGAISVEVDGNPDNLSWTSKGTLLVASHTAGYGFAACLWGRRPCRTSWAVFEIDPATLRVNQVIAHDGSLLGAVSTALQVGHNLLLGSVFDDRIGIVEVRRHNHDSRTAAARRRAA
jgi:sugar lactone lactonase YvrE